MDFMKIDNIVIDGVDCVRLCTQPNINGSTISSFKYEKDGKVGLFIITHNQSSEVPLK